MEVTEEIIATLLEKYPIIKRNADAIDYITWDEATKGIRFIMIDGKYVLQQQQTFCVHYKYPVTHGSLDNYTRDYGNLWLDVPLDEDAKP